MRRLVPINRWLNLHGLPLLRDLPGLRRSPGLAGLCDIRDIQIPDADQTRLRASLQAGQACFLAPNHPEFFTDWMIDKELSACLRRGWPAGPPTTSSTAWARPCSASGCATT